MHDTVKAPSSLISVEKDSDLLRGIEEEDDSLSLMMLAIEQEEGLRDIRLTQVWPVGSRFGEVGRLPVQSASRLASRCMLVF